MYLKDFSELNRQRSDTCFKEPVHLFGDKFMLGAVEELGEVAKAIKYNGARTHIGDEIADVIIYLDLLAQSLEINLQQALVTKFNRASQKVGFEKVLTAGNPELQKAAATAQLTFETLRAELSESIEANTIEPAFPFIWRTGPVPDPTDASSVLWYQNSDGSVNSVTPCGNADGTCRWPHATPYHNGRDIVEQLNPDANGKWFFLTPTFSEASGTSQP